MKLVKLMTFEKIASSFRSDSTRFTQLNIEFEEPGEQITDSVSINENLGANKQAQQRYLSS